MIFMEMRMIANAFWRRLDVPGHDAARLFQQEAGYCLEGATVFQHDGVGAALHYRLNLDKTWITRSAQVNGFIGGREIIHIVTHTDEEWVHNGKVIAGLNALSDLDLGFTPATNLQQIRRMNLAVGQAMDLPVAWLDIESTALVELPQRYERMDATSYWYESPTASYRATLDTDNNNFVIRYPGLWQMEFVL